MPKFNFVSFARARLTFNCKPEGLMLYGQADLEKKKKSGGRISNTWNYFLLVLGNRVYILHE